MCSYVIMQESWDCDATKRPTFDEIRTRLSTILSKLTEDYGYLEFDQSTMTNNDVDDTISTNR